MIPNSIGSKQMTRRPSKCFYQNQNVTVLDGFTLVPHLPEYFLDNLHPNCLGMELYGRNLVDFIRKAGF